MNSFWIADRVQVFTNEAGRNSWLDVFGSNWTLTETAECQAQTDKVSESLDRLWIHKGIKEQRRAWDWVHYTQCGHENLSRQILILKGNSKWGLCAFDESGSLDVTPWYIVLWDNTHQTSKLNTAWIVTSVCVQISRLHFTAQRRTPSGNKAIKGISEEGN